jgi:hypothetical protein
MQLSAEDAIVYHLRKSISEKRERSKLSRIQGTCHPHRMLIKADPPKKQHKSNASIVIAKVLSRGRF